jgi:hypothetical protein
VPFAEATIPVPPARASATLGTVRLGLARAITVSIEDSETARVEEIELLKLHRERHVEPFRSSRAMREVTFGELASGTYLVVAKGKEPWQRAAVRVDLGEAIDADVHLRIEPFPLRLRTVFDGEPLGGARVLLRHATHFWSSEVTMNDEGSAAIELWQSGTVDAHVTSPAMTGPHIERRDLTGLGDTEWTIDVPAREISGVVVDARTGAPVAAAGVMLNVTASASTLSFQTTADEQGRFRFAPAMYGKHSLRAATGTYLPGETTYWFREPEEKRSVTIALERSSRVRVRIVDPRGLPISGARLMQFRDGTRMEGHSDAQGWLDVPVPQGGCDLYVVPRDGSFVHRRLSADAGETSVVIPPGASRIVLRAESENGDLLTSMSVLIRYNGHLLPPEVIEAIAAAQGARTITDAAGTIALDRMPPGLYEIWPVASAAQLRALQGGLGPDAPVALLVTPGENVAVMRFAR